jgi:ParB family transcriptional regulator, chromosome partitioning protein
MMAKKNSLGRGLGALIEDADREAPESHSSIDEIAIDNIEVNPWQPRSKFDEDSLQELADSIREIGIIQPITVRVVENGKYQLITGERRYRAARINRLSTIPAYIRYADDKNMLEMALVENIQREDLDAIEVAISYQRLIEECNLTQESLSERVGKKRATIANYLRLVRLPAEVQLAIKDRILSMGHARALLSLEDPKQQLNVFEQAIGNDLSVRKVEELVRKSLAGESDKKEAKVDDIKEYSELKDHLSRHFGTKIDFKRNNTGSGKIVITFRTDEELEKIVAVLDKLNG